MLNNYQRCLIRAYGKAQITLKSHVVMLDKNYKGNREESEWGYIVESCEDAINRNQKTYEVVHWMHPNIIPFWDEYDILEVDLFEYMHRRFPSLCISN